MEAWKVILLVAALPLAGAAGLAWFNGEALRLQIGNREEEQRRVDQAEIQLARLKEELAMAEEQTRTLVADTASRTNELATTNASISEADLKRTTFTDDIKLADAEIELYVQFEKDLGNIETIEKNMAMLKQSIITVDMDISNVSNLLAVADAKKAETQGDIDRRVTENKNRKAGIITQNIDTKVKAAYNDWGFIVIDAGDAAGIVMNSTLDITRAGKPICKVVVTELEPTQCVGNIIKSSLLPGQLVQVGDSVIKVGAAAGAQ